MGKKWIQMRRECKEGEKGKKIEGKEIRKNERRGGKREGKKKNDERAGG